MLWLLFYSCSKCWDLTSNWCRAIFIINFNNVLLYWDGKSLFLKLEQESRSSVPIRRFALTKYIRQESFLTTRIWNDIKPGSVYTSDILDELIQKKNCRCFIKKDNIVECKLFFSHPQLLQWYYEAGFFWHHNYRIFVSKPNFWYMSRCRECRNPFSRLLFLSTLLFDVEI